MVFKSLLMADDLVFLTRNDNGQPDKNLVLGWSEKLLDITAVVLNWNWEASGKSKHLGCEYLESSFHREAKRL